MACRWSLSRLNTANTAADSPDTRQRDIVGRKRRSMNRSLVPMSGKKCSFKFVGDL